MRYQFLKTSILIILFVFIYHTLNLLSPTYARVSEPSNVVEPTGPIIGIAENESITEFWKTGSNVRHLSENEIEVTLLMSVRDNFCDNYGSRIYADFFVEGRNIDTQGAEIGFDIGGNWYYTSLSNHQGLTYLIGGKNGDINRIFRLRNIPQGRLDMYLYHFDVSDSSEANVESPQAGHVGLLPGGYFDGADSNSCTPYGWSKLNPNYSTNIEIYTGSATAVNGNGGIGTFSANVPRPDLGGNYGFAPNLTNYIGDGNQRYLWIYGVTISGNRLYSLLSGSPKAISCPRRGGPSASVPSSCMQSGTTADISWGNNTPNEIYVDIATNSNFTANFANKYVAGTTSTTTTGFTNGFTLQPSTTYYVRTWNGYVHSATTSFTTPPSCTPPSPTVSNPTSYCSAGINPQIDLSWSATPNTGRYRIYRNNSLLTTTTNTSYTDTAITQNTNYSYYVVSESSLNSNFVSNPSNTVSTTSLNCVASCTVSWPSIPIQNPSTNFTASFTQGTSTVGFNYISLYKDGVRQPSLNCSGSSCSGSIDSGTPGSHQLRVKVWDLSGYGQGNDPASATFCTPTASYTVYNQLAASCSADPTSGTTGQTINWNSSASGGNSSYSYSWSGTDGLTSSSSTTSKSYTSAGTKTANLTVTSGGQSTTVSCSTSISPAQPAQPSISLPSCVNNGYSGSGINFTWRNNDVPVTWINIDDDNNWNNGYYQKAVPQSQQAVNGWGTLNATGFTWYNNSTQLTFNPRAIYEIRLYNGAHSRSPFSFTTPYSCLSNVFCSGSPNPASVNQSVNWSSSASGGTGSYSYSWSGTDGLSGNSSTISRAYSTSGNKTANLTVTSSDGQVLASGCSVGVNYPPPSPPSVSLPICINPGYSGSGITITWLNNSVANTWVDIDNDGNWSNGYYHKSVGGTPNTWNSTNGTGFNGYNGATGTLTYNPRSNYWVRVFNGDNSSTVVPLTPYSCMSNISCSGSPNPGTTNQTITWNSSISGGSGSYSYIWSQDANNTGQPTSSAAFTTPGTKTANLTISGSDGQSLSTSCSVTINNPPLSASCLVNPTSTSTGQVVTWSSSPSGGTGSYNYSWSGTDGLAGTTQSVNKTYPTSGTKTGSVTITSGSQSVTPACPTVNIQTVAPMAPIVSQPACITPNYNGNAINFSWLNGSERVTWIDIDNDNNWNNGYYHKSVGGAPNSWTNTGSTGFNGYGGATGTLTYNPRSIYRVRTWNGAQSPDPSFTTPYRCLQASCIGSPNPGITNQQITWNSNYIGGSGTNTYVWSRDANNTGQPTSNATFSTPGNKRADLVIQSSDGQIANTNCSVVINNPPPTVSCVTNPTSGVTSQSINRTFTANGGNGNYSYTWSGTDSFNGTVNNPGATHSVGKVYTTVGIKTASVSVTSAGRTATANCPNATISAQPPPQPTVSTPACTNTGNNGSNISVSWTNNDVPVNWANIDDDNNWSNGYYQKDVSGSSSTNATGFTWYNNSSVLQFNPNTTYYVRLFNGAHSTTASFRMEQCLTVQCSVNPATIQPNQSATWTASTTGGDGTNRYTYTWTGDENLAAGPTNDGPTNSVNKTYTTTGFKSATVRVQTPAQNISQTCFNQTNVNFTPFLQTREGDVHTNTQIDSPGGPR